MTCWRIKSDLRTRDTSPVLPCPRTAVEPLTPKWWEPQHHQISDWLKPFYEGEKTIPDSKNRRPCWFIQITPKTTINHLPFAYCSPVVLADTCENCSQNYLGSMYCNKICNPLIYKSFLHNPCLCKPRQIFNTFLSHQQEIVSSVLTDTWIFRSTCHTFTASFPKNCSLSLSVCGDPFCCCSPLPTGEFPAAIPVGYRKMENRDFSGDFCC